MDLEKLKVVDLRKELQQRGLDTKGNKAALVKRLKDAMDKESDKGSDKDASVAEASDGDGSHNEEDEQSDEEPEETKKVDLKHTRKEAVKTPRKEEVKKEEVTTPKKEDIKIPTKAESPEKKQKVDVKAKLDDAMPTKTVSPNKVSQSQSQETEVQLEANGEKSEEPKVTDEGEPETEDKEDQKMETEAADTRGEKRKRDDEDTEDTETRGEKRRRDDKSSPEKPPAKKREKTPPKEDEPEIDYDKPQLSWYDCDLHLQVEKKSFLSAKPLNDGCMGYIWAGARATHGISSGKVCFEVKITEELKWEDPSKYMQERKERENQSHRYKIDRRKEKNRAKKDSDAKVDDKTKSEEDKDKEENEKSNETTEKVSVESEKTGDTEEKMDTGETKTEVKDESVTVDEKNEEKEKENVNDPEQNDDEEKEVEAKDGESDKKDDEGKMETDQDKEKAEEKPKPEPIPAHYFRVGFSLLGTSLQLGEVKHSFAYESTGKFITDKQFKEYANTFGVGDVVGAYASIDDETVTITYTLNGVMQPTAITVPRSEFPEENFALFPHVLCRNYEYEINFGANEEPWFPHPEELQDYQFLQAAEKVAGPRRPETRGECEVILMIGLPGSGKTTWVKNHLESTTDKEYTVIGNNPIFERMTVDGQPLKTRFGGSWKMLVDKIQKCLNTLTDIASLRRRNFVIDQTNVFPNAQRRKLRAFEGFKRKAVCVICEDEEHARRQKEHENDYGKSVPESTMLDLKAQMELPEKCDWLEELIFTDLNEEEARKKLKEYTEEANKKGYFRRWHTRPDDKRNSRSFRDRRGGYGGGGRYDRYDRYSQGSWNRPGAGGWGRDRRDNRGPPPRHDAWRQSSRGPRSLEHERRDSRSGYGGGRSGGRSADAWQNSGSGGWGAGNSQGGWNAQMYGSQGYGAWGQQGWKFGGNQSGYGGGGQGGYGSSQGGYGNSQGYGGSQYGGSQGTYGSSQGGYGQQNWNYYGQYSQQQGWGNSQAQTKSKAGGQQANYSQQDWAQYAKQYAQQQQAQARRK